MIMDCNLIALNNADDIMPYGTYKSGVTDGDTAYETYAYPSTNYPIVNIPYILKDFEDNVLPPGHYQVVLAPTRKFLYLVESNEIKASIPVAKLVEKMVSEEEEREKLEKAQKIRKKYKNNPRRRPRDNSEREIQADMSASIKDSHENYYILEYKNGNIQATGYIIK